MMTLGMIALVALLGVDAPPRTEWNVTEFGATADLSVDATPAFGQALAAADAAGGGTVFVPAGRYRFDGALTIPTNVTLRGTYTYAPSHAGVGEHAENLDKAGTVLEVHAGAGNPAAQPFISIGSNSALQGVVIYYPDQKPSASEPIVFPYAVAMRGNNPAISDVELLNPYDGIDAGSNQRALIRNVHGQPLHIGVFVDDIYDIGRIENVHWNPWWSINTPLYEWQFNHGTAFIFGRADWHYVLNTFCYGYNVGYRFFKSPKGVCNGNFTGIGADDCQTAVLVEECAAMALLITNGEFTAFHGPNPAEIRVGPGNTGVVRFVNCAFWGPGRRIAVVEGKGTVGFSDCTFMGWGVNKGDDVPEGGYPAIEAQGGSLLVRGCEFRDERKQLALGPEVERAIITENLFKGREHISNDAKGNVIIRSNAESPRHSE